MDQHAPKSLQMCSERETVTVCCKFDHATELGLCLTDTCIPRFTQHAVNAAYVDPLPWHSVLTRSRGFCGWVLLFPGVPGSPCLTLFVKILPSDGENKQDNCVIWTISDMQI